MTRLLHLGLLVAITLSTINSAPSISTIEIFIGEPKEIPIPANAKIEGPMSMALPNWLVVEGKVLKALPPPNADERNTIFINDHPMDILVRENNATGCLFGDEWADAIMDVSPMECWTAAQSIVEEMNEVTMDDIRIVPYDYAYSYRELNEGSPDKSHDHKMVIVVKSKCGVSVSPVLEFMATMDNVESFSLPKGSIPIRSSRNEDENSVLSSLSGGSTDEPFGEELGMTTLPSTTTTRHSRSTAPVSMISIKQMECKLGAFCKHELEEKTFFSATGGINTFDLTVESIDGNNSMVQPYVMKEGSRRLLAVIPMAAGEHTFRLKGVSTGKEKKPIFAPFSVIVAPDAPKNHIFKLHMFALPETPDALHVTLRKLAGFLKRNEDEIRVANVSTTKPMVIEYWNTSLPTTSCPTKEVSQWLRDLHVKHGKETTKDFQKAFTHSPTIHPQRLEVQWIGECAEEEEEEMEMGGESGKRVGDEEPSAESAESGSLSTLITVVCLLALLLAVLILIVCCVACRRQKATKGGVNEYMSKGTPVVFPDEVEDEQADIPATAPMLVKEERPPLRVSEHSNPLYKPPPPLASTAASPRPIPAGPSAHKLPPPYVPP